MPAASKSPLMEALDGIFVEEKCKVAKWLDSLSKEDREYLEEKIAFIPIGTAFRAVGRLAGVGGTTWTRHYRGECCCEDGDSDD